MRARSWPRYLVFAGIFIVAAVAALILYTFYLAERPAEPDRLLLERADFGDLPGWRDDDVDGALAAFTKSCERIRDLPAERSLGGNGLAGTAGDWLDVCESALKTRDGAGFRELLENSFTPLLVYNNEEPEGLFTGYYEASLNGSLEPSDRYRFPLYMRPPELVIVNLGRFRPDLEGRRIAGKVVNGELVPFAERAEIDKGALGGRDLEIVWVDSEIDAFFLHIQGSGRIEMADGSTLRVGYAAQNGRPYFAIGRELIERGVLDRETVSMQSIRKWLEENPDEARTILQLNASYVFFRPLPQDGPIGASGVALTPKRSLAVDRKFLPLGVPLWLATTYPAADDGEGEPLRRLMIAQDTGGAITGPVRGDVFWGYGDEAARVAGGMKQEGRYWILLPTPIADRLSPAS